MEDQGDAPTLYYTVRNIITVTITDSHDYFLVVVSARLLLVSSTALTTLSVSLFLAVAVL
jgi:hypothetical protein